jgi:catechol 2,3-dioxygenase-like lactoylglutathione lyase family enzyme
VEAQRLPVESISAVTLLTVNMLDAVAFYEALGFHLLYGGPEAPFTSFRVGAGYLNLELDTVGSPRRAVWGRVVFWVGRRGRDVPTRSRGGVRSGNLTRGRTVGRALLPHPRPRRPRAELRPPSGAEVVHQSRR